MLLLALGAALFFPGVLRANSEAQPAAYKLAFILPLTGPGASTAESFKNGVEMALGKLSAAERARIEIVYEDDQMVPPNTISAFRKILTGSRPDLVVTLTAGVGNALAPVADAAKVTHIAAVSRKTDTCSGRPRCFLFWPAPEDVISLLVRHLHEIKARRIAIISTIHDGPLAMSREFDVQAGSTFDVVLRDEYAREISDFRPFLSRLAALDNVDAVIVNLFQGQIGNFSRQAEELHISTTRLGLEIHGEGDEWRIAKGAMSGEWYAGTGFQDPSVTAEYRAKFPESSTYASGVGYDLIQIVRAASNEGAEDLGLYLDNLTSFGGVSGRISRDDSRRLRIEAVAHVVP